MTLPADSHVHSEWSWDAPAASMERSCMQAIELGLPAIAFTEHLDHTAWPVAADAPTWTTISRPWRGRAGC